MTRARHLLWHLAVRFERQLRIGQSVVRRVLVAVSRMLRALPGTSWRLGPPRRYTYDTYAWSTAIGIDRRDVDAPWQTDRAPVAAGDQAVPHQFVDSLKWNMPPTFVLALDDARLWGADTTVITADDTVLADQTNAFRLKPEELPIMRRPWLGRPKRIGGVSATITGAYTQSYFHWMFDLLPRLDVLRRSGLSFDRLIVPDTLGFQRETLDAAGVDATQRMSHTDGGYLRLDHLLFPSMPGTPGQAPPAVCRYLRSLFPAEIAAQPQSHRLFLSRADTNRRKLANEEELLATLTPFGFESVTMGGRSVAEQARLFAQAEVIIAPHGGALTNLVFCQPGAKVVELFPPGYTPVCFWTITTAIGLDYRPLFDDRTDPHDALSQWTPYTVAPARVLDALRELGVETRELRTS